MIQGVTIKLKSPESKYKFQIVLICCVVVKMHLESDNIFFKENAVSTHIHNDNITLTQTFAPLPCCHNWW